MFPQKAIAFTVGYTRLSGIPSVLILKYSCYVYCPSRKPILCDSVAKSLIFKINFASLGNNVRRRGHDLKRENPSRAVYSL